MTDWFQPAASAYQRLALRQWVGRWWWVIVLPIVACGVMAVNDIRFAFVALILLFMVVPFVAFNVHFYNLLSPELRCRLFRQRFVISYGTSIRIEYEMPPVEQESSDESTEVTSEEENTDSYPPICVPDDELIEWTAVERIERCGSDWLVRLTKTSGHKPSFLLVPCEAVEADITYPLYYE